MKKINLKNTSKIFKIILAVQVLVLLFMVATNLHPKQEFYFDPASALHDVNVNIPNIQTAGEEGYKFSFDGQINEETVAASDKFSLKPGAYRVVINYDSDINTDEGDSLLNSTGYLQLQHEQYDQMYTRFDNLKLRDSHNTVEQNIQISSILPVNDLQFNVRFTGYGDLTVFDIQVEEIVANRVVRIVLMILLFLLFDGLWFFLMESKSYKFKKEMFILAVMCVAAVLPYITEYAYVGHDMPFHINRIISLARELRDGNIYPYIYNYTLNGYGYINPIFYSQILLYIPAALFNWGFSTGFVHALYVSMVSVATCLVMYYCALKIFKKTNPALIAAALYTFSTYRLINIMMRNAMGEYSAQIFLPLVFLGFYNVYTAEKGEKIPLTKYLPIIIGITGVIGTHTLSVVMMAMLIGLYCVINIRKTLEWNRFFALAKAAVISFAVNMFYLVPFIDCMSMDLKVNSIVNNMQNRGTYMASMFNSIVHGADIGLGEAGVDHRMTIGFAITLGLFFFALCAVQKDKFVNKDNEKVYAIAKVTFGLAILAIALTSVYVPYDTFHILPRSIYNIITVYQLPWRWLTFATVLGVFCTVAVIECMEDYKIGGSVAISVLVVAAMVLNAGQILVDNKKAISILPNDYNEVIMIDGDGEYLPKGTENRRRGSNLHYNDLMYPEADVTVDGYAKEKGVTEFYAHNSSAQASYVDIPMLKYDNYVAYDKATGERMELSHGFDNRIRVNLPAGYAGEVQVMFHIRKIWLLAAAASAVTVAAVAAVLGWQRKKDKKLLSKA